jgi:hypothetical protein
MLTRGCILAAEMGWVRALLRRGDSRHASTRWLRGADHPVTLVEAGPAEDSAPRRRDRVGELLAAHERGAGPRGHAAGDPAYSEALFVELIRIGQYGRAYALLAPPCQRRWGSPKRFAEAHSGRALSRLGGINVTAVRHLDEWVDHDHGDRHAGVAELDVEYAFAGGERPAVLRRTVHLVAVDGRWRSLSYPVEA